MARVRVMYWKEIPVQVQAEDSHGRISRQLDDRFQKAADVVAMRDGSEGTDEYLDAWGFGPYEEREGTAVAVAEEVAMKLERIPADFSKKIIDMHSEGTRNPTPGAIDHWAES
ncbi:MAG: virulence factor [Chloroflexi bacterium]|nr:virulence factor [Chloroflexota bacterium]